LAVVAVYLGTFMTTLAVSIVSVALPAIQRSLAIDLSGLQWVVGTYPLCLSALMLSAGPVGDRYGRKRAWLIGVAVFMLGSAVCAGAPSLGVLIAGAALQGVAGALVIPGAWSILTQAFPDPRERAHVIGGLSSFSAISLVLGPMLGGVLVDTVGWPSIFLINLPVGAATLVLGARGIAESADPDHAALDPTGQGLSIVFLGALTYALIAAGGAGWAAQAVLVSFGVAAIALVLFVVVEQRVARPVLPVDLFRDGIFASVNFASFLLGFAGYSSLFLFSLFLQQVQGWSASQAGWRMAPVFAAMAAMASLFGRMTVRHGTQRLMILGHLLIAASMLGMVVLSPATPYALVAPLFVLLGIGLGLAVPSTGAAVMESAPRERSGATSATMNALRQSGMTIGIALLGTVMRARAIAVMATGLADRGGAAAVLARDAVQRHAMPPALNMTADTFSELLAGALSQGFAAAVIVAGLSALVAVVVLVVAMQRAGGRRRAMAGAEKI
jgi:EmrB/QacA subfamily drug resistance transporter